MPRGKYDVIIFGASSFVGGILTRYIASQYGYNDDLKWAIAGRSERKLQQVRGTLAKALGRHAGDVDILIADASDPGSLAGLCEQTRVIVSTVGPYALYGEPMVKACVEAGIDYCDLTGEPQWIKRMLDKYEARAVETGARIVHCCGFDSIPSDMGVKFLQTLAQEKLGHPVNRVEMRVKAAKGGMSGGTIASMLQLTKEVMANPSLKKELANPYSICPPDHGFRAQQPDIRGAFYDRASQAWGMPFIMAAINTRVVHRTNALLDKSYGDRFEYNEAMLTGKGSKGRRMAKLMTFGLGAFIVAAALKPTRWLLEKYVLPKPGQGPSEKEQEAGYFDIRFYGYDGGRTPVISTRVTGDKDPGYGFTAKMLGEAAVCLAKDYHNRGKKRWGKGGFWTPGALFGEVFMDRLQNNASMTFEDMTARDNDKGEAA
ncbi:trans-acting enoyl reductase family protein [Thalassolituus sp.]|uniref:saccharopine dehydrogenase family protein n=1 Tax=Thalassolituus sp. TaxID=2030822 RepID=UPI002629827F|nr:saccharopine dehydrogenase NADP-binding domain-containing protein [uncultured Thalassolituus sp.]TNC86487.1 MAG: saccharopine dehydrogenase [Thalassolituus sp.]